MDIETRLSNLENLVHSLIAREDNTKKYTDWDIEANSVRIGANETALNEESTALEDAVCELSESTENSIASLEQALCDLSEEIGGQ